MTAPWPERGKTNSCEGVSTAQCARQLLKQALASAGPPKASLGSNPRHLGRHARRNPADTYSCEGLRFDDLLAEAKVYTTEEVLGEVLTFFAANSWLRTRAPETVHEILSDRALHVTPSPP